MAHKKTRNESTVEEPKAAPLTNKEYAKELKQLHVELVKLQDVYKRQGEKPGYSKEWGSPWSPHTGQVQN